jgi:hypothetical protein
MSCVTAIAGTPAPVFGKRMAHSEIYAGGVVRVVLVDAMLLHIEATGQRAVEQPGSVKLMVLRSRRRELDRDLPAAAQELRWARSIVPTASPPRSSRRRC